MHRLALRTAVVVGAAVLTAALVPSASSQNAAPAAPAQDAGAARGGGFARGGGRVGRGAPPPARPDPLPAFYDPKLPLEKRVSDLVSRLTLEEKVGQMQMAAPAIERLGIAPYDWWNEALHGVGRAGTATVFPQAIGMAATWNVDLHHQMAQVIGIEGRAKHAQARANNDFARYSGIDFWSPNVNIFRDPRWGRGQETYGEDPYLAGRLAISFVKGLQGDDPFYFRTIATPKHFAVHSGPEPLRHAFDAVITDQDLYTTYLPQFEAAVKEGHAYSIMSSYNALNGVPNSGNNRLLNDILRKQWGFGGYVVSDVDSVEDIFMPRSHAYTPTAVEASALAVKSGNDLNSGTTFGRGRRGGGAVTADGVPIAPGADGAARGGAADGAAPAGQSPLALVAAVQRGLINEKELDIAVRRLMEARIRLGEFDPLGYEGNPYNKITAAMNDTEEHDALSHKVADESIVLLKNANRTLPLKTTVGTVAVIGPNADALTMQYGNYNGNPTAAHRTSILDGIRNAVGADHVITTSGAPIPLVTDRVALAEPVKPEYLFTDASRSTKGLKAIYAADAAGLAQPARTAIVANGVLNMPDVTVGVTYNPSLAVKMTGVLLPPMTGDYQLGAKGHDNFRILIDNKVLIDETQGGALRMAGNSIHLEKDKPYAITAEFTHAAPAAGAGRGRGGGGGLGRGGRGAAASFGSSPEAPGMSAEPAADPNSDPLVQLVWTRPTDEGAPADTLGKNLYAESIELAKKADAIVLVVGIDASLEREQAAVRFIGFSSGDRTAIELPAVQENLIKQVTKAAGNKPVVLVNCSGSAIALNWANENVPAILQAWYPGQHGDAVADVLFGKYNPAGRLPVTFYKSTEDLPEFTDYAMAHRTYRYFTNPALYPFGHGLSYSTFEYSGLLAPARAGTGDDVKLSVNVKNTSNLDGDEVVQCYINRDLPSIDRRSLPEPSKMTDELATLASTPRKSLVGFTRVPLKAGQSKTMTFTITTQQLSLVVGKDGKREVRPGNLQIQVGGSSAVASGSLTQNLVVEGAPKAPEYHFVVTEVR